MVWGVRGAREDQEGGPRVQAVPEEAPLERPGVGGKAPSWGVEGPGACQNPPGEARGASSAVAPLGASSGGAWGACWGAEGAWGSAAGVEGASRAAAAGASCQVLHPRGHLAEGHPGYLERID